LEAFPGVSSPVSEDWLADHVQTIMLAACLHRCGQFANPMPLILLELEKLCAVNNWHQLGVWAFHVCRNPQLLDKEMENLARPSPDHHRTIKYS
jgi:hypothetical protein